MSECQVSETSLGEIIILPVPVILHLLRTLVPQSCEVLLCLPFSAGDPRPQRARDSIGFSALLYFNIHRTFTSGCVLPESAEHF